MSRVTSVVLQVYEEGFDHEDGPTPKLDAINRWLAARGHSPLARLTPHMIVDGKHPQAYVFGGGYNYLPVDDFLKFIRNLPWQVPHEVALIISSEERPVIVWTPLQ